MVWNMIMQWWTTFTVCKPENSVYFFFYALLLALLVYHTYRLAFIIRILGQSIAGTRFLHHTSLVHALVKANLFAGALLLLFFTLLHPCAHTHEERITQEGRDLFIALDISRSMLAQDVKPNRLRLAQDKIRSLVLGLESDRVGLILFAGSSFVQCPLTKDLNAFLLFLNQVDTDTIASGTTALDQAITQALHAFESSGTKKNKLLVIVTDGEDFSQNLEGLKQQARDNNITIFTVGIGTPEGAPIPHYDAQGKQAGHMRDEHGNIVISRLNEPLLQQLSHELGGIYIKSNAQNNDDVAQLITQVQRREKEKFDEQTIASREEQYPLFITISLLCLLAEWLL